MIARTITLYKSSFTGLSPQTWLLSFVMLVNRSGTMVVPFMTLYLTSKEMGRSLSEAGFVMGLFGLGSVIGAYFGGRFTDKAGFYKVQLAALLLGGIMFIVLGQVQSFLLICVCTFLLSLVNEAFRPANSSAIAFYSTAENRTRSYSLNRLAVNLGWAVGTSIGGLVASYNYKLLFWVDGITNICAAGLMLLFLPAAVARVKHEEKKEVVPVAASAYKDKTYLWFIFLSSIFFLCFFQMFTTIPNYFRDDLHLGERYIGLIMALNGILIVGLEMVLVYKLEGKRNNLYYAAIGILLCAAAYYILLIPGSSVIISLSLIVFITLGEIISMPFMNSYWISRSNDQNRGQYAALYSMSWSIAQTVGPFFCALLADQAGFQALFIVLGLLSALAGAGFYKMMRDEK